MYRKSSENLGSSQQIGQPIDGPITDPRYPLEQPFAPTGPAEAMVEELSVRVGVDVAALAVARFAHRSEVPEVVRATLARGEDVVAVHQNVTTVLDRKEVDVETTTPVLCPKDGGALKTTLAALATVDREDTHPSDTLVFGLDLGRTDPIAQLTATGKLAGHLKGSGHHGVKVETFDDGAELAGKDGVHLMRSVW